MTTLILKGGWRDLDIAWHKEEAIATVTAHRGHFNFDYQFEVSGKTYSGTSYFDISEEIDVGSTTLVRYSSSNPWHSSPRTEAPVVRNVVVLWLMSFVLAIIHLVWRSSQR